jgi:Protein of unknown function (DUF2589)
MAATKATPAKSAGSPAKVTAGSLTRASEAAAEVRSATEVVKTAVGALATAEVVASAAPSTNLTSELNNIDFRKMIGGPLQAAVDAQVASSLATVDFINKVGFTQPVDDSGTPTGDRELVMVDFSHTRKDVDAAGEVVETSVNVKVPLLAMLPIPSLRIEHVIIDFNVKLNSVESSKTSDELGIKAEVGGGWGPVNFKVSASYQRKTATSVEVKKEYSLTVNVKAVQDEMPAGLEKILGMLAA